MPSKTVIVAVSCLLLNVAAGASLPEVECYPRPIMAWTERFYGTVFGPHGDFSLRGHGRSDKPVRSTQCAFPRNKQKPARRMPTLATNACLHGR